MLSAVALVVLAAQCAPMLRGTFTCDGVQVLSQELTLADADAYCRYGVRERQKVEEYWGPTWTEPIRIRVSSEYRISRALVPAYQGNRGFLEMPSRRFGDKTGALLHEIVHIYAPHQNRLPRASPSTCTRSSRGIPRSRTSARTCGDSPRVTCRAPSP
jgi:hypothetical protein